MGGGKLRLWARTAGLVSSHPTTYSHVDPCETIYCECFVLADFSISPSFTFIECTVGFAWVLRDSHCYSRASFVLGIPVRGGLCYRVLFVQLCNVHDHCLMCTLPSTSFYSVYVMQHTFSRLLVWQCPHPASCH